MLTLDLHFSVDGSQFCGPFNKNQILNPVKVLAHEFYPVSPRLAKFLVVASSNACILSIVFILASVYAHYFLMLLGDWFPT